MSHGHDHDEDKAEYVRTSDGRLLSDPTLPANRTILISGLASVALLVGLKFGFDAYMEMQRAGARHANLAESRASGALEAHRASVRERLSGSAIPIDQAITRLEAGRRAFPQVMPSPSSDQGARVGWVRRSPEARPVSPEPEN